MFRIIALVGALVATPAAAGWFSYDSYEDCILDKMKGQTEGSRWTVSKVCSKALRREENIGVSDRRWSWSTDGESVTITPKVKDDTFTLSRGKFTFSSKPCEESKNDDFEGPIEFVFHNDEASMRMIPTQQNARCMRGVDVWGRYK